MEVAIVAGVAARRTSCTAGAAEVLREETGKGPAEARRGTGPSPSTQIEARTSGRASAQQGHTATCQAARTTPQSVGRARGEGGRMSPEERGRPGTAGRGRGPTTLGGATPQRGEGARGTVMAREVPPYETLCSMCYGKRSYGLAA